MYTHRIDATMLYYIMYMILVYTHSPARAVGTYGYVGKVVADQPMVNIYKYVYIYIYIYTYTHRHK